MLRRRSTKTKDRRPLGRSKSTSCIYQSRIVDLHSDPHIGQRDAHIAARLSYQRAHYRRSEEMAGFSRESSSRGLHPDEGRVSRHDFARSESACSQVGDGIDGIDGNNSRLSRQRSVRFTGPGSRQRRNPASRTSEFRNTPTPIPSLGEHMVGGFERRARSAVSDRGGVSVTSSSLNPLRLMHRSGNPINFEDQLNSSSSPERRIRKSKSMFTTFQPVDTGYYFSDSPAQTTRGPQASRYAYLNKENAPLVKSDVPSLRGPKSMSFLRNRRNNTSSHTSSHAESDLAVQLAREKFREQVEGQSRLKSSPSIFFRSNNRRAGSSMGLPKSLRNSSNNSAVLSSAFSGDSLDVPRQGSLRKAARKVSSSIKTRLKGVFGRRTSGTSGSFARGDSEANDTDDDGYLQVDPPGFHEEVSFSRGPSRIASIHAVPSPYKMRSLRGSIDSCERDDDALTDEKSRVTSWTDSVTNTVASHAGTGEWERQRLSVIKENGLHVSSSGPLSSMASQDYAIRKAISVDSQRVYSALMQRAREAEQREEEDRRRSVDDMRSLGRGPPRSSSVNEFEGQSWSPPTIRCVQPEDDVFKDEMRDVASKNPDSPRNIVKQRHKSQRPVASANGSPNPWSDRAMDIEVSPGKASVSSRLDVDRAKTLTHRSSAFFASPANHLFRTASPFRRALRESMKSEAASETVETTHGWNTGYLASMPEVSLPARRPSPMKSGTPEREMCAESIYSSVEKAGRADPSLVTKFPVSRQSEAHGDATIFVSQSVKPSPRPPIRDVSTASSVEWKTWLSSHVSKLEGSNIESKAAPWSSPDLFPKLGHIRENAEIESPSDTARSPIEMKESPGEEASLKAMTAISGPYLTQKCPNVPRLNTPGDENTAPSRDDQSKSIVDKQLLPQGMHKFPSTPSIPISKSRPSSSILNQHDVALRQSASLNTLSQASPARNEELSQRRRARRRHLHLEAEAPSAKSSPGLTAAVERQFGKTLTGSPAQHTWRRHYPESSPCGPGLELSSRSAIGIVTKTKSQTMNSKQMVNSFLHSRREQQEGSDNDVGSSPAAFV